MPNLNLKQRVKSGELTVHEAKSLLVAEIGTKDAMQTKTWHWLERRKAER